MHAASCGGVNRTHHCGRVDEYGHLWSPQAQRGGGSAFDAARLARPRREGSSLSDGTSRVSSAGRPDEHDEPRHRDRGDQDRDRGDQSHEFQVMCLHADGRETLERAGIDDTVVGWHASCLCGWRAPSVHLRLAWPTATGFAPEPLCQGPLSKQWKSHTAE